MFIKEAYERSNFGTMSFVSDVHWRIKMRISWQFYVNANNWFIANFVKTNFYILEGHIALVTFIFTLMDVFFCEDMEGRTPESS